MNTTNKKLMLLAITAALLGSGITASAQGVSFFRTTRNDGQKRSGKGTVITSQTLDIDIENNIILFNKDVVVDDEELKIECEKMTVHLENAPPPASTDTDTKKTAADPKDAKQQDRQISRIICEKDVIIIRKLLGDITGDHKDQEQKATAGHADYDVKTGKIVLTKNPVIQRGADQLKGEVITIWRDSEKVSVQGKAKMLLESETVKDAQNTKSEQENEGNTEDAIQ